MPLPADMPLTTIDGDSAALGDFDGRALLIVNVASQCGFTPQYAGLEALHRRFRDRGFAVLGFPCDQFGHQEPGDESAIRKFCADNYGVTFPMFAKINVNGEDAAEERSHAPVRSRGLRGGPRARRERQSRSGARGIRGRAAAASRSSAYSYCSRASAAANSARHTFSSVGKSSRTNFHSASGATRS